MIWSCKYFLWSVSHYGLILLVCHLEIGILCKNVPILNWAFIICAPLALLLSFTQTVLHDHYIFVLIYIIFDSRK
jgi:hypothetical protein